MALLGPNFTWRRCIETDCYMRATETWCRSCMCRTATHWNTLQHIEDTATYYSSWGRRVLLRYNAGVAFGTLQRTATRCNTTQHIVIYCSILHLLGRRVRRDILLFFFSPPLPRYNAGVAFGTLQRTATRCNTTPHIVIYCHRDASSIWVSRTRVIGLVWYYYVSRKLIERNPPPRGDFLFTMFPHQESWVRGPPSKNLYQVLRGGSSYSRFLMREHSK